MQVRNIFRIAIAAALLLPVMVAVRGGEVPAAEAQGAGPALCSGIQLQNTNTSAGATITMNFYRVGRTSPGGPPDASISDNINPNSSKSYYLPNILSGVPDGQYAVTTNSDQALNALVQQVSCPGASPAVAGSFSGVSATDTGTSVVLPYVLSRAFPAAGSYSSFIAIQNAGSATATNVQVAFYPAGSSTPIVTLTNTSLPANETWYLNLRTGTTTGGTSTFSSTDFNTLNGFAGSATITADQPVAAVANYSPADNTSLLSYNGTRTPGTTLYAPQVTKSYFGFTSGFTLVNQTATASAVRFRFVGSASGNPVDVSVDRPIVANGTLILYLGNVPEVPNNFNGTGIISIAPGNPSVQLVGIANLATTAGGGIFSSGAMNLVPSSQASTKLYLPQQSKGVAGFTSGWQIVDTTGAGSTGTASYYDANGNLVFSQPISLAPNGSVTVYLGNVAGVPNGFNGGVVVQMSGAVAGQGNYLNPSPGDLLTVYNAFPG